MKVRCFFSCEGLGLSLFVWLEAAGTDLPNMILFRRFNKRGESPLLHASAKSNVGHEEANAGTCGFIKAPNRLSHFLWRKKRWEDGFFSRCLNSYYLLLFDFSWNTLGLFGTILVVSFFFCVVMVFSLEICLELQAFGWFPPCKKNMGKAWFTWILLKLWFFKPPVNLDPNPNRAKMSFSVSNVVRLNFIDRWWCCWMVESLLLIHTSLLWIPTWMSLHTQWCLPMWHGASKHREGQVRRVVGPGMWEFVGSTYHLQSPCTLHKVSVDLVAFFVW